MLKAISKTLQALHRDEQGADMVEYILIVAAIALPVLALVIWFWKDMAIWAKGLWDSAKAEEGHDPGDLQH